jgi:hypothetical protein
MKTSLRLSMTLGCKPIHKKSEKKGNCSARRGLGNYCHTLCAILFITTQKQTNVAGQFQGEKAFYW